MPRYTEAAREPRHLKGTSEGTSPVLQFLTIIGIVRGVIVLIVTDKNSKSSTSNNSDRHSSDSSNNGSNGQQS